MEAFLGRFVAGLAATTWPEAVAVVLGFVYAVLAVRRNRWCWVAGGISCAIFVYLALRARLPMQSLLQTYYVLMSFYGWWHWSRATGAPRIGVWPLRSHLVAVSTCLVASLLLARVLATETQAAWPFLDSFATALSLVATYLEARVKVENWAYFFVVDCMLVFLFVAQGLVFSACLFASYLVISVVGFVTWLRRLRQQTPVSTPAPA